jgi:hypothetical protein
MRSCSLNIVGKNKNGKGRGMQISRCIALFISSWVIGDISDFQVFITIDAARKDS